MAVPGSRPFHGRALTFARGSDQIRRVLHNCRVRITVACAPNADRPHARETGTVVTRLAADMTFTKSPAEEAADNPHCIQPSASTKPIAAESLVVSSNMRPRRGRDATQHVVPLPMVPGGGENVPRDLQNRGPSPTTLKRYTHRGCSKTGAVASTHIFPGVLGHAAQSRQRAV